MLLLVPPAVVLRSSRFHTVRHSMAVSREFNLPVPENTPPKAQVQGHKQQQLLWRPACASRQIACAALPGGGHMPCKVQPHLVVLPALAHARSS